MAMTREQARALAIAEVGEDKVAELEAFIKEAARKVKPLNDNQKDGITTLVMAFAACTKLCDDDISQEALVSTMEMLAKIGRADADRAQSHKKVEKDTTESMASYASKFVGGNGTKH